MYVVWYGVCNFVVISVDEVYVDYGSECVSCLFCVLFVLLNVVCFLSLDVACCVVM